MKWAVAALILVLAVAAGTWVSQDPGYLLIAYGGYQLETSLWVALILFFVGWVSLYVAQTLLRQLFGLGTRIGQWRENRSRAKTRRFVQRAWALGQVGEVDRALTYLKPLSADQDWGPWARLMQARIDGGALTQGPAEFGALEEAAIWELMNQQVSAGQFEEAFKLNQTLPRNAIVAAEALDIALASNEVSLAQKAVQQLNQYEHLPTDDQLMLIIARARSANSDESRHAWLSQLTRLPPEQDVRLFNVLSMYSDPGQAEDTARTLVKRWPLSPLFLIYGLLAGEFPQRFDKPLKKLRSKAINEDALRLLDAARMEALDPEASLEAYLEVASRVESRLLRQRVLLLASKLGRQQTVLQMVQALT